MSQVAHTLAGLPPSVAINLSLLLQGDSGDCDVLWAELSLSQKRRV